MSYVKWTYSVLAFGADPQEMPWSFKDNLLEEVTYKKARKKLESLVKKAKKMSNESPEHTNFAVVLDPIEVGSYESEMEIIDCWKEGDEAIIEVNDPGL